MFDPNQRLGWLASEAICGSDRDHVSLVQFLPSGRVDLALDTSHLERVQQLVDVWNSRFHSGRIRVEHAEGHEWRIFERIPTEWGDEENLIDTVDDCDTPTQALSAALSLAARRADSAPPIPE